MPSWIAYAALAIAALSLLLSFFVLLRGRGSRGRGAAAAAAVPADVGELAEHLRALAGRVDSLEGRAGSADAQGRLAIQRVGVVRYNPFADTGSNQSFVLALLDARGDGFVLSSLHSRQQTRVFLKQITAGKADTALSDEEAEAIRQANAG